MKRPPLSLKAQALALLSRREHSRAELRSKLLAHARKRAAFEAEAAAPPSGWGSGWEGDPFGEAPEAASAPQAVVTEDRASRSAATEALLAEIDAVLDWLQTQRYQSDERFIESRLNSRAPRQGLARLRQDLARHGVSLDAETVQSLRQTEVQRARDVWRKRFDHLPADASERARQMRFLAARGFSGEVVRKVLGGGGADDDLF